MEQERRNSQRFVCEGDASLRITPTWPEVRGKVQNIGLGGCVVKFADRQKIEDGQRVELLFNVRNLQFHVLAMVKGERGKGLYGFAFPPLRERVRLQLEDLLEELQEDVFDPEAEAGAGETAQ